MRSFRQQQTAEGMQHLDVLADLAALGVLLLDILDKRLLRFPRCSAFIRLRMVMDDARARQQFLTVHALCGWLAGWSSAPQ